MDILKQAVLIKYGGNAMTDESIQIKVIEAIAELHISGNPVVLVHGGGPIINKMLNLAGIKSEFIDGQRVTTSETMEYVQMALRGQVNGMLVRLLNNAGVSAVGLSGKDGGIAKAVKRYHNVDETENDIGYVGNVSACDTKLIEILLQNSFLPVVAPVAIGMDGYDYNINADIFAGELAAALKVKSYVSLTDVDGLYKDIKNPDSRIPTATLSELKVFMKTIASGGMLPKLESIQKALESGVKEAHIFNGTKPEDLKAQLQGKPVSGTKITID